MRSATGKLLRGGERGRDAAALVATMAYHLQFRRYRLPLRLPVRTAHEHWTERQGVLVRLEHADGRVGLGEAAPIPAFGTETTDDAVAVLGSLGEWPESRHLAAVPPNVPCVRHAIADALRSIEAVGRDEALPRTDAGSQATAYRAVAALLPAGKPALRLAVERAEAGFRTFKWKVAVDDPRTELGLLDELCAVLPNGARLRLDPNGAWGPRTAERWLERCAERPVECVEQPSFAPARDGETAVRRAEDVLRGLAEDYPTPIALDESVVADADVDRWLSSGWRGWFVVKPTLLADADAVLGKLAAARATVVFSSALETVVGARTALQRAFAWPGEAKALGFGVWPLFRDARCDGPAAAPYLRPEDLRHLNPEAAWTALA